jgi:hypothetical protein
MMMRRENCNCWDADGPMMTMTMIGDNLDGIGDDAVEDEGGFDVVAAVAGDGVVVVVALGNCLK